MRVVKIAKRSGDTDGVASIAVFRTIAEKPHLLLAKSSGGASKGMWNFPGGHIKSGEEPSEGAARELREETAISVRPDRLAFVYERRTGHADRHFLYSVIVDSVDARAGSDAEVVKWAPLDEVGDLPFFDRQSVMDAFAAASKARQRGSKGVLIAVEGPDGTGKTTQAVMLKDWLAGMGYPVMYSKWNSSDLMSGAIQKGKARRVLTPMLYSLMHAADMIYRYENEIVPFLDAGGVVICDRYWYTSAARDSARGVSPELVSQIYKGLRDPDVLFHLSVPSDVALGRMEDGKGLSWYGSGMDIGFDPDKRKNCAVYLKVVDNKYGEIMPGCRSYRRIDGNRSKNTIHEEIRVAVAKLLMQAADKIEKSGSSGFDIVKVS